VATVAGTAAAGTTSPDASDMKADMEMLLGKLIDVTNTYAAERIKA
jgi:hypothetical protein